MSPEADVHARRSIEKYGLFAAIGGGAAPSLVGNDLIVLDGPKLPFTLPSSFCGSSPLSGHSLQARNCDTVKLTDRGLCGLLHLQPMLTQHAYAIAALQLLPRNARLRSSPSQALVFPRMVLRASAAGRLAVSLVSLSQMSLRKGLNDGMLTVVRRDSASVPLRSQNLGRQRSLLPNT